MADKQKYFDYLENLRKSGVRNMWAATPYLAEKFGISENEAGDILVEWIKKKQGGEL